MQLIDMEVHVLLINTNRSHPDHQGFLLALNQAWEGLAMKLSGYWRGKQRTI